MHASIPHPFSSWSLYSIHPSFFSSGWDIVCFHRQSTFSQCSDWLILRQRSKVMFRGPDLQWNVCVGVVIRALSRIHLRIFFFVETCRCKNSWGFMSRLKHVGMFMPFPDLLNFFVWTRFLNDTISGCNSFVVNFPFFNSRYLRFYLFITNFLYF